MILAYWCVLLAGLMPVGFVGIAKFLGERKMNFKDNHHPRKWLEESEEGPQKRAYWAQLNSFEAFPLFAAGVFVAVLANGSVGAIDTFAVLFLLLRVVYGWCYITDRASLRSLAWFGATGCSVILFLIGAWT